MRLLVSFPPFPIVSRLTFKLYHVLSRTQAPRTHYITQCTRAGARWTLPVSSHAAFSASYPKFDVQRIQPSAPKPVQCGQFRSVISASPALYIQKKHLGARPTAQSTNTRSGPPDHYSLSVNCRKLQRRWQERSHQVYRHHMQSYQRKRVWNTPVRMTRRA